LAKVIAGLQGRFRLVSTRSVDEDIDGAQSSLDHIACLGEGISIKGVGGMEHGLSSFASNFFSAMHASFGASAEDGYASTSVSESRGHRASEATSTTNDYRYLIMKLK
jgi:hypothetical protein